MESELSAQAPEALARPLYQQVAEIMLRRIAEGHWKSGEMLPSEPKLAVELGVSPGTVRKALDQLAADQLVTRRQGLGTSIAVSTREDMLYRFFKLVDRQGGRFMPACREIKRSTASPNAKLKKLFQLTGNAKVLQVVRLRLNEKTPIMTETVTLPLGLFKGLDKQAAALPTTLYDFFETRFGLKVLRVAETITAVAAKREDAKMLNVTAGAPLLCVERLAYTFDDQIIEHRLSQLSTESHAYLSELT